MFFGVIAWLWATQSTGLVGSNDGSHLALARALALRQETAIDPDLDLTLHVDYARRGEHVYSDRPPGTAMLAIPAVAIGNRLDKPMLAWSQALGELVFMPASPAFVRTYATRSDNPPPLRERLGTVWMTVLHAVVVGLAGLVALGVMLRRLGHDHATVFAVTGTFAVATLWGPYATTLFAHASAAGWVAVVLALTLPAPGSTHSADSRWAKPVTAGFAAAMAVATEYTLALPMTIGLGLSMPARHWLAIVLGAAAPSLAVATYHHAAFGSPWSIGYEHHAHFDFARAAASTFSGDPFAGLWTLLGGGHGAGLLVQSPIVLVALWGWRRPGPRLCGWLWAFAPWLLLLAYHRTPFGGGTLDHRYLVPVLPLCAVGFARVVAPLIDRSRVDWRGLGLAVLVLVSIVRVWSQFLGWHEATPFGASWLGGSIALTLVGLAWGSSPLWWPAWAKATNGDAASG